MRRDSSTPTAPAARFYRVALIQIVAALVFVASGGAQNFSITGTLEAEMEGYEDGVLIADDFDSGTGLVSAEDFLAVPGSELPEFDGSPVGRAVSIGGGSSPVAEFGANSSGIFFMGAEPALRRYDIVSEASWSSTVTPLGQSPENYELDLAIDPIELRFWDNQADPPGDLEWAAGYSIEVLLDGTAVWSSAAEVFGNRFGVSLTQSGTTLTTTSVNTPPPEAFGFFGYDFGPHDETIALGTFDDQDDPFNIDIRVTAFIDDVPNTETGAYVLIGDPENNLPGVTGVIPEPSTYALLGGLLAVFLATGRRARFR